MDEETSQKANQLWAPWRLDYILTAVDQPKKGCFLCEYRDAAPDGDSHVIFQDEQTMVVLNRFPYNNGHLLIAPRQHKGALDELDDAEMLGCVRALRRMVRVLQTVLAPHGFNIGLNLGRVAGAGLPEHLHWHVVPRWNGDTNFMPVLADTKVIPQSLEVLSELLRNAIADAAPEYSREGNESS